MHRFEHRRLRASGGPVHFVGQQEVGEDRPPAEFEIVLVLAIDGRAGDVAGQQVGRHLHAAELHRQRGGNRTHEQRFGDTRRTFEQHVTTGE